MDRFVLLASSNQSRSTNVAAASATLTDQTTPRRIIQIDLTLRYFCCQRFLRNSAKLT